MEMTIMQNDALISLVNCTNAFLKLLIKHYNEGNINYDVFESSTRNKIKFLNENVNKINEISEKENAKRLLTQCYNIIYSNNTRQ